MAAQVELYEARGAIAGPAHRHGRRHRGHLRVSRLGVLENPPPTRERLFARGVQNVVGRHAAEGRGPQGRVAGGKLQAKAVRRFQGAC